MMIVEKIKYFVYRTPLLRRLMQPGYQLKIAPDELIHLCQFINATRGVECAIAEIGVAQGGTSIFILEHLKTSRDPRKLFLVDTFGGFTAESLDYEANFRNKSRKRLTRFTYGDEAIFQSNLRRRGYTNFQTVIGDCAKVDWRKYGPFGAVLLDVDLYKPTLDTLEAIWPLIVPGGGIVVDDVQERSDWDGAHQAYSEFVQKYALPFEVVGGKGGILRKPV